MDRKEDAALYARIANRVDLALVGLWFAILLIAHPILARWLGTNGGFAAEVVLGIGLAVVLVRSAPGIAGWLHFIARERYRSLDRDPRD